MSNTVNPEHIKRRNDEPRPRCYEVGLMGDNIVKEVVAHRMERDDKNGATFLNERDEIVFFVAPGHLRYALASELLILKPEADQ